MLWHSVTPVLTNYDPIVSESDEPTQLVIFNAGPDAVEARAWTLKPTYDVSPCADTIATA